MNTFSRMASAIAASVVISGCAPDITTRVVWPISKPISYKLRGQGLVHEFNIVCDTQNGVAQLSLDYPDCKWQSEVPSCNPSDIKWIISTINQCKELTEFMTWPSLENKNPS